MFEVIFLGTSASAPSAYRGLSALVVRHKESHILIDCGEGTERQLLRADIAVNQLRRIFLTHGHLDHMLGLGGLASSLMESGYGDVLEVCGGRGALDRVRTLMQDVVLRDEQQSTPLYLRELFPGTTMDMQGFKITAFLVKHRGPDSLGYLFEEPGAVGGPEPHLVEAGGVGVTGDGHRISPGDVMGRPHPDIKLAIVGDTGHTDNMVEIARGADALVIESTYLDPEVEMARRFSHLTARDAADLAVRAGVKQLILTHISRRNRGKDVLAEARAIFPNTMVARDLERFQVGDSLLNQPL